MPDEALDKHQLAGLDDRERGFSRPVDLECGQDGYRAILRYETLHVVGAPHAAQDAALLNLVEALHARGFRQLKSQRSFRNGVYLGSNEIWVEYQDPWQQGPEQPGFIARLFDRIFPNTTHRQ
ncbi:hypothetical protein [Petrachloros mirabilis]